MYKNKQFTMLLKRTRTLRKSLCIKLYSTSSVNDGNYLNGVEKFSSRHIGPNVDQQKSMLETLGFKNLQELTENVVPDELLYKHKLSLDEAVNEYELLNEGKKLSEMNEIWRSYIGMGYYNCYTPSAIHRNIFENPAWTTSYTAYQPEISQGRLESLMNFQTLITELTGLDIANASLLDEATAAAEAMALSFRKTNKRWIYISEDVHPHTIGVVKTRALSLGLQITIGNIENADFTSGKYAALLVQYPNTTGDLKDNTNIIKIAHDNGIIVTCATDLLALTLVKPPSYFDVDIAVGSSQRFGIPLGYGGPHAAFFACKSSLMRLIPGRIVGVTRDADGNKAYRLMLQTREQHIKRDKATSNICTAQALLANISAMYALYHGPIGLKNIASTVHNFTRLLFNGLLESGNIIENKRFFDTLTVKPLEKLEKIKENAVSKKINLRYFPNGNVGISLDETVTKKDIDDLLQIFGSDFQKAFNISNDAFSCSNGEFAREGEFLKHPVFNSYHSETKIIRYMKTLESKDVSLVHSMIPLGSCTMKLNGTSEMMLCSLSNFANIHPFVPKTQVLGYELLIEQMKKDICNITGFDDVSFQPNSGAQGEYAGLMAIRNYHESKGENRRNVCLIPLSAHGTNPASAHMAGMKIEPVMITSNGSIDLDNLKFKINKIKDNLSCIMLTYPSTNGVFEGNITEICNLIHKDGGQVYLDGGNMNAQIGLCRPGDYGADVVHLNLHKTFCIPHGGGGPGVGPIAVKSHLTPFLPKHAIINVDDTNGTSPCISAAPYGSSLILPISWAYLKLMGPKGLKEASQVAILNANYMSRKLEGYYKTLYRGNNGLVAHEFIIDLRQFKSTANIEVADVAKRLMDYGYHSPTMSWPVPGTLMIEPTESEDKEELDRFCDALISIRSEIQQIEKGEISKEMNAVKMAPHTQFQVVEEVWDRPYTRKQAAFPLPFINGRNKVWPTVTRVDDVYGDKNPVCTCPSMEYAD